nr:hypothetical protein [uncultured Duganella sp.]
MNGVLIVGGRLAGKVTALRMASKQQTMVMTGQVHGLATGDVIHFNGANFGVVSRSQFQALIESLTVPAVEPAPRSKPGFGSDRPYLKKKKGRS